MLNNIQLPSEIHHEEENVLRTSMIFMHADKTQHVYQHYGSGQLRKRKSSEFLGSL